MDYREAYILLNLIHILRHHMRPQSDRGEYSLSALSNCISQGDEYVIAAQLLLGRLMLLEYTLRKGKL